MDPAPRRDFALLHFCLSFSLFSALSLSLSFFFFRRICDEGLVQNRNKRVLIKAKKRATEGFEHGANERRPRRQRAGNCCRFPEKMFDGSAVATCSEPK